MNGQVTASQALRIAFEDRETIHFILTSFSRADEHPDILSSRWLSGDGHGSAWNIVIIEKPAAVLGSPKDLINAALLELDSATGVILRRTFFKGVFSRELQRAVKQDLGILLEGCRVPRT